jgi:4-amino-4-deoxy-L-arabinose transferase-like glycosyltransferase
VSESPVSSGARPGRGALVVGALLLTVLMVKSVVFAGNGQAPLYRDALGYWNLGAQAAAGDWLLLDPAAAARLPGYPYLLAFCQLLFGDHALVAAVTLQQFFIAACAGIVAWVGWRVTGSTVAVPVALGLSLVCVSRHVIAAYLWSGSLLALMLTLHVASLVSWLRKPAAGWAFALGATLGLSTLTRPVAQFAFVPVLVTMGFHLRAFSGREPLSRFAGHAAIVLAAMMLVLGPWLVRNQVAFGEAFLTRFQGRTLWLSSFDPMGAGLALPDEAAVNEVLAAIGKDGRPRDMWGVYGRLRSTGRTEVQADDMMARAARSAIRSFPVEFGSSVVQRFLRFWTVPYRVPLWRYNDPFARSEGTYLDQRPAHSRLLRDLSDPLALFWRPRPAASAAVGLATLLALLAMARRPEQRSLALGLGLLLVYFALVPAAVSTPVYRFRAVLEPIMVAVLTIPLTPLVAGLARGRQRHPPDQRAPADGPIRSRGPGGVCSDVEAEAHHDRRSLHPSNRSAHARLARR